MAGRGCYDGSDFGKRKRLDLPSDRPRLPVWKARLLFVVMAAVGVLVGGFLFWQGTRAVSGDLALVYYLVGAGIALLCIYFAFKAYREYRRY